MGSILAQGNLTLEGGCAGCEIVSALLLQINPALSGLGIPLCLLGCLGAVIGAILIGVNEALTSTLLGGQYVLITQFLLIIVVLLIRPRGIAGILDKAREA